MQEAEAKIAEALKSVIVKPNGIIIQGKFYPRVRGVANQPEDKIVGSQGIPGRKAIRVYVERKLPVSELSADELLPKSIELQDGTEVELDVVAIDHVQIVQRTSKQRPFPMGVKEQSAQA